MKKLIITLLLCFGILSLGIPAFAATTNDSLDIAVDGGLGLGPDGTFALVGGMDFTLPLEDQALQVSPLLVYISTEKTYDYTPRRDQLNTTVFGAFINWLYNYDPEETQNFYYITGVGFVYVTDNLVYGDGSGTKTTNSSGFGFDLGLGRNINEKLYFRVGLPVMVIFHETYTEFMPTILATVGYRI
ncbi:MAG TPA: hypothetical protein VHY08_03060 [Bacillota bacterium]|nr:hypothetical protein [Bacillota bacterium]